MSSNQSLLSFNPVEFFTLRNTRMSDYMGRLANLGRACLLHPPLGQNVFIFLQYSGKMLKW